jgi:hypothetical protein
MFACQEKYSLIIRLAALLGAVRKQERNLLLTYSDGDGKAVKALSRAAIYSL